MVYAKSIARSRKTLILKLAAITAMLIYAIVLIVAPAVNGAAVGFCELCSGQCYDESYHIYHTCKENGGTNQQCLQQQNQYYYDCQVMFCGGCPIIN